VLVGGEPLAIGGPLTSMVAPTRLAGPLERRTVELGDTTSPGGVDAIGRSMRSVLRRSLGWLGITVIAVLVLLVGDVWFAVSAEAAARPTAAPLVGRPSVEMARAVSGGTVPIWCRCWWSRVLWRSPS
jgi:hypothetical protein